MQKNVTLKQIIQTALLIAITLVLRNFSYMLYFSGGAGLRMGISVFFSKLPALLFGPFLGGIAEGVTDVLAYIIKPDGGYIPLLTVTAIFGGVLCGVLWKPVKNLSDRLFKKIFITFFSAILIFGIINWSLSSFYPDLKYSAWLLSFGKKTAFMTVGLTVTGMLFPALFFLDKLLKKKLSIPDNFMKLFTVLFIANIIVTTLNTFILMIFIPAVGKNGFMIFYIPRFIEECIITTLQSYVVSYLLSAYNKIYKR